MSLYEYSNQKERDMTHGQLAKEAISKLDQLPHTEDRAMHKLRMIEVAEKEHAGIPLPAEESLALIEGACNFLSAKGV